MPRRRSDLSPGVTGNEPEIASYEGPCNVCGKGVDDCICPECLGCGAVGDPYCYGQHGLVRSQEQIDSRAEAEAREEPHPDRLREDALERKALRAEEAARWREEDRRWDEAEERHEFAEWATPQVGGSQGGAVTA